MVLRFLKGTPPSRKDLLLVATRYAEEAHGFATPSRLHKVITIAQEESGVKAFTVEPGDFGPKLREFEVELERLVEEGLTTVEVEERPSSYGHPYLRRIRLTEKGRREAVVAERRLMAKSGILVGLMKAWARSDLRSLIYYVYDRYPQYTRRSRIKEDVEAGRYR